MRLSPATSEGGPRHLLAARDFAAGDLVLAEIAVLYWGTDTARAALGGGSAAVTLTAPADATFVGPFAQPSNHGAVVRLLGALAPLLGTPHSALCACSGGTCGGGGDAGARVPPPCATRGGLLMSAAPRAFTGIVSIPAPPPRLAVDEAAKPGPREVTERGVGALFVRANLVRHACCPNTSVRLLWDSQASAPAVHLVATGPIAAGTPITVARVDTLLPIAMRQRGLTRAGLPPCTCARCCPADGLDDTVAIRCPACSAGVLRLSAATDEEAGGEVVVTATPVCAACGASAPPPATLQAARGAALDGAASAPGLAAARRVLHDYDTALLVRLFASLPSVAAATATATSPAGGGGAAAAASTTPPSAADVVATSGAVLAAARALPYFCPLRLLRLAEDHGILAGAVGDVDASRAAWEAAAVISRTYYRDATPHWVEMHEAFAARPPRNRVEAGAAERMRRLASNL